MMSMIMGASHENRVLAPARILSKLTAVDPDAKDFVHAALDELVVKRHKEDSILSNVFRSRALWLGVKTVLAAPVTLMNIVPSLFSSEDRKILTLPAREETRFFSRDLPDNFVDDLTEAIRGYVARNPDVAVQADLTERERRLIVPTIDAVQPSTHLKVK